jgi:hypothetical protein
MLKVGNLGGNFIFETGATWRSPGFEINDLGFMRNADEINQFAWVARRWQQPFSIFRRFQVNANYYATYDFGGTSLFQSINTNSHANFVNFWSVGGGGSYMLQRASKTDLRGGPVLRQSPAVEYFGYVSTDNRKNFTAYFNYYGSTATDGSEWQSSYFTRFSWQALDALSLSAAPSYSQFVRADQYVTQEEVDGKIEYIVGRVDQRTLSLTLRLNYNLTPDLTLQYYGQPFISRGTYTDFKRFTGQPQAVDFGDRFKSFSEVTYNEESESYEVPVGDGLSIGDPDFSFIQFRSNLVARWEYHPGSEIFLVWAQGNTANEDPQRSLTSSLGNNIFSEDTRNNFLVKVTYRWLR